MPPNAQRGGGDRSPLRNPGINPVLWGLIRQYSAHLNLDPYAVATVSRVEGGGRFGAVGDHGTSFGPFQLHVGGALPMGKDAAWANSPAGVLYALQHMAASGAAGLRGQAAVRAIVTRFERPAAPAAEVSSAWAGYRSFGGQLHQQMVPFRQGMATQFAKAQQNLLAQLQTQAAQSRQQALAQQAATQLFQRHQAAQQAQMQLVGQPAAGLTTDPTTNLVAQQRQKALTLRQEALQRAGLA